MNSFPKLATDWSWSDDGLELTMNLREGVVFHDGTPFNADAVVANIDRSQNMPESRRKSEVASISKTEATSDYQVKFTLSNPDATLLAQFSDRAGMMLSPTAAKEMGVDFGNKPVCSGPYKFVERIQQDRMVLEKFAEYWNADNYEIDKVTYLPIPDTSVRLANLRSGDLDMLERLAATDVGVVKGDANLQYAEAVSLGYQGITMNINNTERGDNPLGNDAKVRQALSLSIDREALNQVVFDGVNAPGNQSVSPSSPWYVASNPLPARDLDAAKALLKEAGIDRLAFEVQVANNPTQMQVMQVIQSMAGEAGFDITLKSMEFASLLADQSAGNYQASQIGWSGRVDPDGNIHQFMTCGGGINDSKFCNEDIDNLLNALAHQLMRRCASKVTKRLTLFFQSSCLSSISIIKSWLWALQSGVSGFVPYPDGMIRLENVDIK